MFLAASLAASPAGLLVSAEERRNIATQARLHTYPKRFAARAAAALCLSAMEQGGEGSPEALRKLKKMWNDGTPRAVDFPLYDADCPNDNCVQTPSSYFRVQGKRVL
ncbi:MAG: hypothetical protein CL454_00850 [Acidimicrobiaceae bacterium]|nr:hypothetical protein [Acidimicrobiaceae bacterium]